MSAAVGVSVALHVVAGLGAVQLGLDAARGGVGRWSGGRGLAMARPEFEMEPLMLADFPPPVELAREEAPVAPPSPPVVPVIEPPVVKPEELNFVRPGIDQSPLKTDNWMGFIDPTEHAAPLSTVDQPELSPDAGSTDASMAGGGSMPRPGSEGDAPAEAVVMGPPAPEEVAREGLGEGRAAVDRAAMPGEKKADERPDEQVMREDGVEESLPGANDPGRKAKPEAVEALVKGNGVPVAPGEADGKTEQGTKVVTAGAAASEAKQEATVKSSPAQQSDAKAEDGRAGPVDGPAVGAGAGNAAENAAPGTTPGQKSEKQSPAASTVPVDVKLFKAGRTPAGEGLEIITRTPRFTNLQRVLNYPGNPTVDIHFRRNGLVSEVKFITGTGAPDIDESVKNALFNWVARGAKLRELSEADPKAEYVLRINVLLR